MYSLAVDQHLLYQPALPLGAVAGRASKVLIGGQTRMVIDLLACVLEPEFEVVGTVTTGTELLRSAQVLAPRILLVETASLGLNQLGSTRQLVQLAPETALAYLTMDTDPRMAAAAFTNGASAILCASDSLVEMHQALHLVATGSGYLSRSIADGNIDALLKEHPAQATTLSCRELDVLRLSVGGRTMIARSVRLSAMCASSASRLCTVKLSVTP